MNKDLNKKRIELTDKRNEVLARFKSLHKLLYEAGADLANANADLARIDEQCKIHEVVTHPPEEEE